MAAGRPQSTFDLPEGWHETVLELYSEGASDVEIKAEIYSMRGSFSNDLWDRWRSEEPEFSETIKIGKLLSEAWWHKNGRKNLSNKDFNFTGWYMNMKNRFGWKDNQSIDHTSAGEKIQNTPIIFTKGANEGTDTDQ